MYAAALIDDHPILRLGLARILGNIASIGEVYTYDPQSLSAATSPPESDLDVQILLFGLSDSTQRDDKLLETMTNLVNPRYILLLAETRATPGLTHPRVAGRVAKSASSDLLEAAVRLIMAGGRCFPFDAETDSLEGPDGALPPSAGSAPSGPVGTAGWPTPEMIAASARSLRITPRQFEILLLRAHGYSHKAVGQILNISEATVKAHASAMYRRLDVSTRQEAVKLAADRGIQLLGPYASPVAGNWPRR